MSTFILIFGGMETKRTRAEDEERDYLFKEIDKIWALDREDHEAEKTATLREWLREARKEAATKKHPDHLTCAHCGAEMIDPNPGMDMVTMGGDHFCMDCWDQAECSECGNPSGLNLMGPGGVCDDCAENLAFALFAEPNYRSEL